MAILKDSGLKYETRTFQEEDAELLEMIERADNDQDGEINFEEFYAIMTKKTFS